MTDVPGAINNEVTPPQANPLADQKARWTAEANSDPRIFQGVKDAFLSGNGAIGSISPSSPAESAPKPFTTSSPLSTENPASASQSPVTREELLRKQGQVESDRAVKQQEAIKRPEAASGIGQGTAAAVAYWKK